MEIDTHRLKRAIDLFKQQHAAGAFPGGQIAVRWNGELVVNEATGLARGYRDSETGSALQVGAQTPFPVYSCGKPLAATAIAVLEDRGRLDVNAPIAEVFPEFGRHGKELITTLDVLTHRSGVLLPHLIDKLELWGKREIVAEELADTVPKYPRGTLAYAPWEFGWILGEIIQRVDGRDLATFCAEEIAEPLELSSLKYGFAGRNPAAVAHAYWFGKDKMIVAGVNVADRFEELNNHTLLFESLNPACTLITDANSLTRFYDFVLRGGTTESGRRLVSDKVLRRYTTRHVFGFDRSAKTFLAFGRGFAVGTLPPSAFGWWDTRQCFGHGGSFSCLAGADYRTGLSWAILTNGNRSIMDYTRRFVPLSHMIRTSAESWARVSC